jgi:hemerythrin-like metal-binding protein
MEEPLKWDAALDVGVKEMNDEHKVLVEFMNALNEINRKGFDKDEILRAFDRLADFAQKHFQDEEEMMQREGYPSLQEHQRLHASLLHKMVQHRQEYSRSVTGRLPGSVFDFLKLWMVSHIMIADRKYGEFIRMKGQTEKK